MAEQARGVFFGVLGQDICIYMEIWSSMLDSGSEVLRFLSAACKGMNGSMWAVNEVDNANENALQIVKN